jgi:hypothetical protein
VRALIGAAVAEPPPEAERSNRYLLIDGRAEESITAKSTRTGMSMDAGTVLGLVEDAGLSPRETIASTHLRLVDRATGATSARWANAEMVDFEVDRTMLHGAVR